TRPAWVPPRCRFPCGIRGCSGERRLRVRSISAVPPAKGPYAPPTSLGCQRLTGVHPVSFTGGLVQTVKQQIRGERQVKPDQRDISDFVLLVRVSPQTLQQCMTVTISRCCG
ncbi:unnamed protein product, partial [Tetraodon nigroviridis]